LAIGGKGLALGGVVLGALGVLAILIFGVLNTGAAKAHDAQGPAVQSHDAQGPATHASRPAIPASVRKAALFWSTDVSAKLEQISNYDKANNVLLMQAAADNFGDFLDQIHPPKTQNAAVDAQLSQAWTAARQGATAIVKSDFATGDKQDTAAMLHLQTAARLLG
jgi:hypothetical protein